MSGSLPRPRANRGCQLLAATGVSSRKIGSVVGVSHHAVSRHLRGDTVPDHGTRLKYEQHYGIPAAAWDQAPAPLEGQPDASAQVAGAADTLAAIAALPSDETDLRSLVQQIRSMRSDPSVSAASLAKLAAVEMRAARELAEIEMLTAERFCGQPYFKEYFGFLGDACREVLKDDELTAKILQIAAAKVEASVARDRAARGES
jgi:transcriptional regulator with XRE-family HTH domain